jgi:hypothetical protein
MTSAFCTICERLGDTEGVLCCEAFPRAIPATGYPWGCMSQKCMEFKPKAGMEEIAKRWAKADAPMAPE